MGETDRAPGGRRRASDGRAITASRREDRGIGRSADPAWSVVPYHGGVRDWLTSVLGEPRAPGATSRTRRDTALVAVASVGATVEAALRPDVPWRWPTLAVLLVLFLLLPWRREQPLAVMASCFAVMNVFSVVNLATDREPPAGLDTMGVLLLAFYAVCRWASGREVVAGVVIALTTAAIGITANYTGVSDAIGGFIVLGITVAVALAVRFRDRAQRREIEQVRFVERAQLARDLHDTVAHHVSAIAIRAQAGLAVAATRPEAALEALRIIDAEAGRTLAEMRAMVGVLRQDQPAELAPVPTLTDLEGLAGHPPGAPPVEVSVAPADVAPAVAAAVFRIAQEAVTNARRHARHATRIVVSVTGDDDRIELRVADDGDPVDHRRAAPGYGLRGMTERAELLGGSCSAGPSHPRGWAVEAALPRWGVPT